VGTPGAKATASITNATAETVTAIFFKTSPHLSAPSAQRTYTIRAGSRY
jgi:hypothetical protein